MSEQYRVTPLSAPVRIETEVPGSKSMTNRALLLAALADGESVIKGCGMSDDSRVFSEAIISLGFECEITEEPDSDEAVGNKTVRIIGCGGRIPRKQAGVYVGSAGTAARFLTAMTGLSDGEYELTSSEQMKRRPMRPLLEALECLGARFVFHEEPYRFPFTVIGAGRSAGTGVPAEIPLNIDESSQFLSALLLCGPMVSGGFDIRLTGQRTAMSYVKITAQMMRDFGYGDEHEPLFLSRRRKEDDEGVKRFRILPDRHYKARAYTVEPDVSAACYFYAIAAVCGGSALVKGINRGNSQGDMRFLDVLEQMGCTVTTSEDGTGTILLTRDPSTPLHGVCVDMSDFSDQTMTLACVAPFADSKTTIRGISHIRGQESDRIHGIVTELTRIGFSCEAEHPEDPVIVISPGKQDFSGRKPGREVTVETYDDHRMAMAFSVIGTRIQGIVIDHPDCCKKTFAGFFTILDRLTFS